MDPQKLLAEKKSEILGLWFQAILDTYPSETATFLKKQKDQFVNPVGYAISKGIEGIFEEVCLGVDPDRVLPFLDRIIRVRAIQDFPPSKAIFFMFQLKKIIRDELVKDNSLQNRAEVFALVDSRIDELLSLCFDNYMECREKLYEIKINEIKGRAHRLLKRAEILCEESDLAQGHIS